MGEEMREIKFRAWDKYAKKMIFDFAVSQYNKFSGWINCVYCGLKVGSGGSDDYILMQYTGLKDKNGKEIYEGDILENSNIENKEGNKEKIIVKWSDDISSFGNDNDIDFTYCVGYVFDGDPEEMIIIGNIYENPELLEEK